VESVVRVAGWAAHATPGKPDEDHRLARVMALALDRPEDALLRQLDHVVIPFTTEPTRIVKLVYPV
jgi:hypothetical protein